MISIITAIYNQYAMNQLFYENLKKYTYYPFELIIIDNASTDKSAEYFKSLGSNVKVISNNGNYSYPYCQNQGIKIAKYDIYAFLNNDIIVAPHWDKDLLDIMNQHNLEIITPSGTDRVETPINTKKIKNKWKYIKGILSIAGFSKKNLSLMHKLMYGNWEEFCQKRKQTFGNDVVEGFVGNSVIMKKTALEKIGLWDERIQCADFDLYMKSKERSLVHRDIKPVHIALGIYHHHYIRLTYKQKYPPYVDKNNLIELDSKWDKEKINTYLKDIDH